MHSSHLTHCLLNNFACFSVISFFRKKFRKSFTVTTVWIQIRPDILPGLIWVQTVCKGYQQTTLVVKEIKTEQLDTKQCLKIIKVSGSTQLSIKINLGTSIHGLVTDIQVNVYIGQLLSWLSFQKRCTR